MFVKVLSVTALNNYVKKIMDNDVILNNIRIRGEISNFKLHDSGHMYFSLKDEQGKINAVMFRGSAMKLDFMPKSGVNVEVKGRVSVYAKDGSYQLYCDSMTETGLGDLYIAFNKLKEKLMMEGLFDQTHKKPLPLFSRRIGVITSPTGAAIRDIINVSKRRNKNIDILIYPSLVQGAGASTELIKGIEYLNSVQNIDVIIIARGGGSIEELWEFNNEALAYAVFKSKKPVISGVGHETDFTIVDFVSDMRASTPSAAAEIAVSSATELNSQIVNFKGILKSRLNDIINRKYNEVAMIRKSLEINNPINNVINSYNVIDNFKNRLEHSLEIKMNFEKQLLSRLNSVILAHNPINVINRGYAILQDTEDNVISDIQTLKQNKEIKFTLKDGSIKGRVDFTQEEGEKI